MGPVEIIILFVLTLLVVWGAILTKNYTAAALYSAGLLMMVFVVSFNTYNIQKQNKHLLESYSTLFRIVPEDQFAFEKKLDFKNKTIKSVEFPDTMSLSYLDKVSDSGKNIFVTFTDGSTLKLSVPSEIKYAIEYDNTALYK